MAARVVLGVVTDVDPSGVVSQDCGYRVAGATAARPAWFVAGLLVATRQRRPVMKA